MAFSIMEVTLNTNGHLRASPSVLCTNCVAKFDNLTHPPIDAGFHHSIRSRLRDGFNLSIFFSELSKVNAFLADVPDSLSGYDQAIKEMEQMLQSLKFAREDLCRRSDNALSLSTAPIRKLPPEVLEEIFASYVSSADEGFALSLRRNGRRNYISCPTLKYVLIVMIRSEKLLIIPSSVYPLHSRLSWVCSFWRSIVTDLPKLWSSMRLSPQVFLCQTGAFPIFLKYFHYSGDTPLDIHFDGSSFDSTPNPRADKAMDILLDNSMRWRSAVLSISTSSVKDWFSAAARQITRSGSGYPTNKSHPGDFSSLVRLDMPQGLSWTDELSGFFRHFSSCPRLESYHGSSFSLAVEDIDFSHVKEFSLTSSLIGKSFGHLLYRLPALESLSVANFEFTEDGTDVLLLQDATHYTSSLSKLKVTSRTLQAEAWRFVRLPLLTELHISIASADHFEHLIHLSSVLLESQCQLQTLQISIFCFMEQQQQQVLLDFIALHSSLAHLAVIFQSDEEAQFLVDNMHPKGDPPTFLAPNLRTLEIQWTVHLFHDFDQTLCSSVCEMVKSRCPPPASGNPELTGLESLTLVLSDQDSYDTFSSFVHGQLLRLEEGGLTVNIQSDFE
ncbi:hypothetical protein D9757_005738 [Collybiopsis confluens]|uniref:F-box domain-containing protein n=1 Tax=Collybiopsis confluens TaxID=2823264 RepID=A0A8H5MB11_9AGAR|nr:hypothetical protein D9757_005738 [Collybiopsis confluens]